MSTGKEIPPYTIVILVSKEGNPVAKIELKGWDAKSLTNTATDAIKAMVSSVPL